VKKVVFSILALITLSIVFLPSCTTMEDERQKAVNQIATYQQTQPIPKLDFSNTRQAVIDRIERWSDPNKISYIYLVSFGRVMAFYTVKGSVECKQSYLTPVEGQYGDLPDIDGTYGDNMDSIFFFTTDKVYVEWHGDYMWVDQPLKFQTAPELYYDITDK
jgi:hypothetical protein